MTITNKYQGIKGTTTKGEITTYIEKKTMGFFWTRVDIGQPDNQWHDVIYNYMYIGDHTFQLASHGTYRITVIYVISGTGGDPDTITRTTTKTYYPCKIVLRLGNPAGHVFFRSYKSLPA